MNFQNPYLNPFAAMPQQMVQPVQQVTRVNGENGARAYQIGPNSSAMLLDESGTLVWLVTTDGAGYRTVAPYDITPHKTAPAPDYGSLEDRIKRLEEIVNASTDTSATGRRAKDIPADRANDPDAQISRKPAAHAQPDYADEPADAAGYENHTRVWRGRE